MPTYNLNDVITNRIDKKVNYGKARTAFDHEKGPNNEAIVSPIPNPTHNLWIDSHLIPAVATDVNTATVNSYQYKNGAVNGTAVGESAGVIELTRDPTVADQRSWLACSTVGDGTTRLNNWLRATYGATYLPKFAIALAGGGNGNYDLTARQDYEEIYPQSTDEEYYWDYESGVFVMVGNPNGNLRDPLLTQSSGVYTHSVYLLKGYRYIGTEGLQNFGGGGGSSFQLEVKETGTGANVTSTDVTSIQFDVDSGFALTDLGNKAMKIAMESTFKHWNIAGQDKLTATAVDEITLAEGNGIQLTTTAPPTTTQTYYVKFDSGKYIFEDATGIVGAGTAITSFNFVSGGTYKFDTSNATLVNSQFEFSTVADGTHASGQIYTNGITYGESTGTRITDGSAGAFLQIVAANDTAEQLYDYYEDANGSGDGSGATITWQQKTLTITNEIVDNNNNIVVDGKYTIPGVIGAAGQVLRFPSTGTTLEWGSSGTVDLTDLSVTNATANATSTLTYDNTTGVFTYVPLDEQDPVFLASPAGNITTAKITDWDTAHGWGDHGVEGYLKTYTETDPVFGAHVSSGITQQKITNWDAAHAWTNHATQNYFDKDDDDLTDIRDVDTSALNVSTNGYFLRWNSTAQKWKEELTVVPASIDDLTDVDTSTTSPTVDQVLRWVAGTTNKWVNSTLSIPTVLDDLTDVDTTTTTPVLNQVLKYDGTKFTPQLDTGSNTLAGLTDVDVTSVSNGKIISYLNGTWVLDDKSATGATVFTGLTDTPSAYTSQAGKFVKVATNETSLEFADVSVPDEFIDLTDTPANYTGSAGFFVKVKNDGTGLEFINQTFLQNITQENFTDLYDVAPVSGSNDTNFLYYDHPSTSFKWKAYELKNLEDVDALTSTNDQQIAYYNHATTSFKFRDYTLTQLLDVAGSIQADDEKVLYYDYGTNSYKWKALTLGQIIDIDTPVQGDDDKFLQYDFANSKFIWSDYPKVSIRNEGTTLTYEVGYIDFVGDGVNASAVGDNVTVTIDGNPAFIGQTDTPPTFSGNVGKMLIVNSGATGLQFTDVPTTITDFINLNDVLPNTYSTNEGKLVTVNSGATGLIFTDKSFISLDDTPSTMANEGGKYIAIKANETGLEFVNPPVQIDTFSALQDTPGISTGDAGKYIKVNSGGSALEFVDAPDDITTFAGLSDTPNTLSGNTGKYLRVSASGTDLEFVDALPSTFLGLTDTPASFAGSDTFLLTVDETNAAIGFTNKTALGYLGEADLTNYTVGGTISTDNVIEGSTNKYYTEARVDTNFGSKNASDLADVDYANAPTNNDVLIWNSTTSKWEPGVAPDNSTGEANTVSNVGTGTGVFKQKTGVDLEFHSISAGTGISVIQQGNNIQIGNLAVSGPGGSAYIEEDDAIAFAIAFA